MAEYQVIVSTLDNLTETLNITADSIAEARSRALADSSFAGESGVKVNTIVPITSPDEESDNILDGVVLQTNNAKELFGQITSDLDQYVVTAPVYDEDTGLVLRNANGTVITETKLSPEAEQIVRLYEYVVQENLQTSINNAQLQIANEERILQEELARINADSALDQLDRERQIANLNNATQVKIADLTIASETAIAEAQAEARKTEATAAAQVNQNQYDQSVIQIQANLDREIQESKDRRASAVEQSQIEYDRAVKVASIQADVAADTNITQERIAEINAEAARQSAEQQRIADIQISQRQVQAQQDFVKHTDIIEKLKKENLEFYDLIQDLKGQLVQAQQDIVEQQLASQEDITGQELATQELIAGLQRTAEQSIAERQATAQETVGTRQAEAQETVATTQADAETAIASANREAQTNIANANRDAQVQIAQAQADQTTTLAEKELAIQQILQTRDEEIALQNRLAQENIATIQAQTSPFFGLDTAAERAQFQLAGTGGAFGALGALAASGTPFDAGDIAQAQRGGLSATEQLALARAGGNPFNLTDEQQIALQESLARGGITADQQLELVRAQANPFGFSQEQQIALQTALARGGLTPQEQFDLQTALARGGLSAQDQFTLQTALARGGLTPEQRLAEQRAAIASDIFRASPQTLGALSGVLGGNQNLRTALNPFLGTTFTGNGGTTTPTASTAVPTLGQYQSQSPFQQGATQASIAAGGQSLEDAILGATPFGVNIPSGTLAAQNI